MIELKPGDLFVTKNPQMLGRGINAVQTWWSKDGKSEYSHAGIILNKRGTTFEALWTIKEQNLFDAYAGEKVCIARWAYMTPKIAKIALSKLMKQHKGHIYPGWRLLLQVIPPVAKYTSWGGKFAVCSELVAKFLYLVHLQTGLTDSYNYRWPRHSHFCGCNPDMLADEWHRWKNYEIIFEDILSDSKYLIMLNSKQDSLSD